MPFKITSFEKRLCLPTMVMGESKEEEVVARNVT